MVVMLQFVLGVSQGCMSSLFVMFKSFWMIFWEHKKKLVSFLSITEETEVVVHLIYYDV